MLLKIFVIVFYSMFVAGIVSISAAAVELPPIASGVVNVDTEKAAELQKSGALFIDVRSQTKWSIGHISNAVHLDFLSGFEKLYHATIPKNTPIVIYGESRNGIRGAYAASTAIDWGYTNVHYYKGGYFSWLASNLPSNLKMVEAYNALTVVQTK